MKKSLLCLMMAAVLTFGFTGNALAEEYKGTEGWKCEFNGKKMTTNFNDGDMKKDIFTLEPGDKIELKVDLETSSDKDATWYISNEVLKTLEDTQTVAEGGAYTYELLFEDAKGNMNTIYSSETVGGEGKAKELQGLYEATNAMNDFILLDTFKKGETGTVYLNVSLEGETQFNYYQDTLAKLQLKFAAETSSEPPTPPKTGDTTQTMLFSAAGLVSGLILLYFGIAALRKREKKEEV